MKPLENCARSHRGGAVLVISMIMLVIISSLAVSIASMSGSNVQLAENLHEINQARASAESGFYIIRYWLSRISFSGSVSSEERIIAIASALQSELENADVNNITVQFYDSTITIPEVILDSITGKSFSAEITLPDNNQLIVDVTGYCNQMAKTISANYTFDIKGHPIFEYGVATKGPLSLTGNVELDGVNLSVEASVFIESESSTLALSIVGNSQIAGNVNIVNSTASVYLQGGKAGIGGETGQDCG